MTTGFNSVIQFLFRFVRERESISRRRFSPSIVPLSKVLKFSQTYQVNSFKIGLIQNTGSFSMI